MNKQLITDRATQCLISQLIINAGMLELLLCVKPNLLLEDDLQFGKIVDGDKIINQNILETIKRCDGLGSNWIGSVGLVYNACSKPLFLVACVEPFKNSESLDVQRCVFNFWIHKIFWMQQYPKHHNFLSMVKLYSLAHENGSPKLQPEILKSTNPKYSEFPYWLQQAISYVEQKCRSDNLTYEEQQSAAREIRDFLTNGPYSLGLDILSRVKFTSAKAQAIIESVCHDTLDASAEYICKKLKMQILNIILEQHWEIKNRNLLNSVIQLVIQGYAEENRVGQQNIMLMLERHQNELIRGQQLGDVSAILVRLAFCDDPEIRRKVGEKVSELQSRNIANIQEHCTQAMNIINIYRSTEDQVIFIKMVTSELLGTPYFQQQILNLLVRLKLENSAKYIASQWIILKETYALINSDEAAVKVFKDHFQFGVLINFDDDSKPIIINGVDLTLSFKGYGSLGKIYNEQGEMQFRTPIAEYQSAKFASL